MRTRTAPKLNPREAARIGPRNLKDPNSLDYAWQTVERLKTMWEAKTCTQKQWDQVVSEAEQHRIYDRIPPGKPYRDLSRMLMAEIGMPPEEASLAIRTHERSRLAAEKTAKEDVPSGQGERTDLHESRKLNQKDRAKENGVSYQTQQRLDRLARDFPDLHAKVRSGELSVNRASIVAGIATETFSVPADPEGISRVLVKRLALKQIKELIRLLEVALQ